MMKKKIIPLVAAMALMATTATSFAYQDQGQNRPQGPDPEAREAIMEAVADGDYDTWYELITADGNEPRILEIISADNFAQFSQMHQLIQEAREKMQEAKQIGADLGLPEHRGRVGHGRMQNWNNGEGNSGMKFPRRSNANFGRGQNPGLGRG